jgi:hypothetical protein
VRVPQVNTVVPSVGWLPGQVLQSELMTSFASKSIVLQEHFASVTVHITIEAVQYAAAATGLSAR